MNKRRILMAAVALLAVVIIAVTLVNASARDGQPEVVANTPSPTVVARQSLVVASASTATATAIPVIPTATGVPAEPTALPPTDVPVETTQDPNLTNITASDGSTVAVDLSLRENWGMYPSAAYALQVALRDQNPEVQPNPRPDDFGPVEFTIPADRQLVIFGHGTIEYLDQSFEAASGDGWENVTVITNQTGADQSVTFSNYAHSGYSVWPIVSGGRVNDELLTRYTLGRGGHCGLNGPTRFGCQQTTLHQVTFMADGTVSYQATVYNLAEHGLPLDNAHLTVAELNDDWADKPSAQALADEQRLFSQPVTVLGETASVGITYGKYAVVIAESLTLTGPDGDVSRDLVAEPGKLYLVVLSNTVGDTAVFRLENLVNAYMYEYVPGATPHTELLARAMVDTTKVTAVEAYQVEYARILIVLDTTSSDPVLYTEPLP